MSIDYSAIVYSTPEELTSMLKDDNKTKEFANYVIYEGKSKRESWIETFNPEVPLSRADEARMYRWFKRDSVIKWMTKANKSLEVDWIDKRVNALQHLYNIGMDAENSVREQTTALDVFLTKLDKEQNKILLETSGNTQVSIVQIVQEKLSAITQGSTIQPDLLPVIEAEVE